MMAFFKLQSLDGRATEALERIASALEYFAVQDARANRRMFIPGQKPKLGQKDESEIMHTNSSEIAQLREQQWQQFLESGRWDGEDE
jgi:hypothetical protein